MTKRTARRDLRRPVLSMIALLGLPVLVVLPAGQAAATLEAPGAAPSSPLPARPRNCRAAPSWVDATPDSTASPAPGLVVRTWSGPGRDRVPLRVVAAQADTVRFSLSVAVAPRFGSVLDTTALVDRSGATFGVNGDYFESAAAGAVPRGVEVQHGVVLFGPAGTTKAVGVGTDGALHAGYVRSTGSVVVTGAGPAQQLPVTSVNTASPSSGIAVQTAYGSAQPRRGAWFVRVHSGVVVSSSSRDPGRIAGSDLLLLAPPAQRAALAKVAVGAHIEVRTEVRGADGVALTDAVGSSAPILTRSAIVVACTGDYGTGWRPRTVVAWDNRRAQVWLITINAMSRGASGTGVRGVTYGEAADLARQLGATDAVLLDGGHSTTAALRGGGGVHRIDAPATAGMRPVPDAVVLAPS